MFIYRQWDTFCKNLNDCDIHSIPAYSVLKDNKKIPFLVLKHDVETDPHKALRLALIEYKYNQKGVYYVQTYLMKSSKNIEIFKKIQSLGNEVSYHHDVMDSTKGNIEAGIIEFQKNIELFSRNGFEIKTVCQHGNPVVERVGYNSNRDFFRNESIAQRYADISEIMVNYKYRVGIQYSYISDVGFGWKIIYDPENNDIIPSEDKNIALGDLNSVFEFVKKGNSIIISTHPHRWYSSAFCAYLKDKIFILIKIIAKLMMKIPFMKKLMSRYYYLAKKI